ncbi:MAG: Sucraseferredoxin family protein [Pseudonocardiales bacterium]|nr:Sucraseferredoxin family protein [Pseudonocardiales bacterium]
MLGTAFPASRVLLVEQPGPWGHGGLRESEFDSAVARELEQRFGRQGVRVLAVRNPGRANATAARRWGIADCRPGREQLVWGSYGQDAELLTLDIDADLPGTAMSQGTEDDLPTYLVCAHSKHDVCCALRGRPVAAGLHETRPGRVWECSHVGGERFAANVLVLPMGLLYGRVPAFATHDFASEIEQGNILASYLRGRIGLAPAEQAALIFGHTVFELARIGEVQVIDSRATSPVEMVVRLQTPEGVRTITLAVERSEPALLTCHASKPGRVFNYRPVSVSAD